MLEYASKQSVYKETTPQITCLLSRVNSYTVGERSGINEILKIHKAIYTYKVASMGCPQDDTQIQASYSIGKRDANRNDKISHHSIFK